MIRAAGSVSDALADRPLVLRTHDRVTDHARVELRVLHGALDHLLACSSTADDERSLAWGDAHQFSAGAVYRMLKSSGCGPPLHDLNWAGYAPLKVKVFVWILRHGNTRTRAFLRHIGCLDTDVCPFCLRQPETLAHLFFTCSRQRLFWRCTLGPRRCALPTSAEAAWVSLQVSNPSWGVPLWSTVTSCLLWVIWKTRNRMVFDAVHLPLPAILEQVIEHLRLWRARVPSRVSFESVEQWCAVLL
uniref:Uncharacterized protein n=1 Tax=Avena sativa TaxID=4498 RepID=A0ACD5XVX3_AVESA